MFAGKTSALLRNGRRYEIQNKKVFYISYQGDQRYDAHHIVTHDLWKAPAECFSTLTDAIPAVTNADVIVMDEGQFFPDIARVAEEWANQGKVVLISALISDYQRKGFKTIDELLPKVEFIHKLSAICITCKKDAHFTHRIGDKHAKQIEVGGKEMYIPLCRACFMKKPSLNI